MKKYSFVRLILIAVGILAIQFLPGAFKTMISPVLAQLAAYLKADIGWTSLVGTVPSLTMVLGSFIAGILASKYNNKLICLIGLGLFFIGGIAPIFCSNLIIILIWRGVLGVGVGLARLFAMSWIPVFFSGRSRDIMMGFTNAAGGLMSSLASLIGGYLGTISWQAAFWGYSAVIVVALLVLLLVPEPLKIQREKEAEAKAKGEDITKAQPPKEKKTMAGVPAVTWHYGALLFLEYCCVIVMYSIISSHLAASGLGKSMEAGVAISVTGFVMAVVAVCFVGVTAVLKRWGIPVAMALGAIGYFIMFSAHSLPMIYLGFGIVGAGMGISNPTIFNYVIIDCHKNIEMSNAIVLAGLTLGQFLSSFYLKGMVMIFGTNYYVMFLTSGILLACNMIYGICVVAWRNKAEKAEIMVSEPASVKA
ncbi:MAG: MFS transporter [Peptococcaceae bacterium]|nr:MFS transporter [Peptococcaceae bacterium]